MLGQIEDELLPLVPWSLGRYVDEDLLRDKIIQKLFDLVFIGKITFSTGQLR